MTPEHLAAIKARAEAATPGPWDIFTLAPKPDDLGRQLVDPGLMLTQADVTFINSAREDVPALVAEVDRLRDVLEDTLNILADLVRDE